MASSKADASSAEEAYLQQREITLKAQLGQNALSTENNQLHSVPGGIVKLPFINGGLENAGIACIGGPGLNCILEVTAVNSACCSQQCAA